MSTAPVQRGVQDDAAETIARLTRTVEQQRHTIAALVEAAERRLETTGDELASSRLEQNVAVRALVEDRTAGLKAAERLLRSVIDSLDGRMCILSGEGKILGTNQVWDEVVRSVGWGSAQAGTGADFFDLLKMVGNQFTDQVGDTVRGVLSGQQGDSAIKGSWMRGDVPEYLIARVHPVRSHDEARAVVTFVDITDAMQTQESLRRVTDQAQLLALVAEHMDNAVVITDAGGRIEWVNESFFRLTGYGRDEVIGRRRVDLFDGPFTRTPAFHKIASELAAGRGIDLEFPTESRDGRSFWIQVEVQPVMVNGRIVRYIGVERDVTSRRTAEVQLRAASRQAELLASQLAGEKSLLTGVLSSIPHLVYWKDRALRYAGVNRAFLDLRGLPGDDDVLERTESELAVDELSQVLADVEPRVLRSGEPASNLQVVLTGANGERRNLLLSVLPRWGGDGHAEVQGVIGVAADVTHLSELERQLAQASRLESIGQLAAGIAHEINTPVQYVSDNTTFVADSFTGILTVLSAVTNLLADAGSGADGESPWIARLREALGGVDVQFLAEEIPSALAQSQEGLTRVTQIVRAMKDFSHPGQGRTETDLNRAVESTVQVSRNEWRYVAELELNLSPDVGMVPCYEGELKQVLLNIVVNAAQAIGEDRARTGSSRPGRITVTTRRGPDAVQIVITDDGPGMPEQVRRRIFDPFFTTKPVGQGTGQGLSMAYAIVVQKHGGKLEVDSAPGAGATFTITLPLDPPDEAS